MERIRLWPSFMPPVLITESADDQAAILRALEKEIKPGGIIEKMYVAEIASIAFEILRLRRCKTGIINTGFRAALRNVLTQLIKEAGEADYVRREEADALALGWFTDKRARENVSQTLRQFGLDESAIEAQSIRRSAPALEQIDRMLASLESRRNKALRCVAEYRGDLARQLQQSADRIIEAKTVRQIEHASGKKSAAA